MTEEGKLLESIGKGEMPIPDNMIYGEINSGKSYVGKIELKQDVIDAFARSIVDFIKLHPEVLEELEE